MDASGRIVVPKSIREQLHLTPGAELELDVLGDSIVIRHCDSRDPLVQKQGVLVHQGPKPADVDVVAFLTWQRAADQRRLRQP